MFSQFKPYWTVGPETNHAAVLNLKPLSDIQEMTNHLELEPFGFVRSPCQGMPLQGPVCTSEDFAEHWNHTEVDFRSDDTRLRHPLMRKLGALIQIAISRSAFRSLKPIAPFFPGANRSESVPQKAMINSHNLWKFRPSNAVFKPRSSAPGGLNVIRKEAWLSCRTSSCVCLCWELEEYPRPRST